RRVRRPSAMRCRWVMVGVAWMVVSACGQPAPAAPPSAPPPSAPASPPTAGLAGSFTGVEVLASDADATFFYNTRTSLRDCDAQRKEMPLVWLEHVRGRLKDVRWTRVTLFPQEPSRASASFTFERDASGAWRAYAP